VLRRAGGSVIFEEHVSGADRERPQLRLAIERCRRGEVLVVVRIDRLARSLSHLLAVIETLDRKSAGFRSLGDPIDTASPQGRLILRIVTAGRA
jgi:DNA invertase Pin-like site-specific DNA recombinase